MATTKTPKESANGHANRIADVPAGEKQEAAAIVIPRPQIITITAHIKGLAPLLICRMSQKAKNQITDAYAGKPKAKTLGYDPVAEANDGRHISTQGWDGFHAASIRGAMIDACRNYKSAKMTEVKQAVFVIPEGVSADGSPLIRIVNKGHEIHNGVVRLDNGTTAIRNRPIYNDWTAVVTIRVFAGLLSAESAINLLDTAGQFCGIGEWRPTSKESKTGSFGLFEVNHKEQILISKIGGDRK
jgi:hypothetical protein